VAVKLNQKAFDYAKELVNDGRYVYDERDAWIEHQPSARQENEFIEKHGIGEYARWFLGIDDEQSRAPRAGTRFRTATSPAFIGAACSRPSRARGNGSPTDIENAAAHLHGMLEAVKT
jgi:hypothetical protein